MAVSPVTLSVAVTVTSAVPVVPFGAARRKTPFWVSLKAVTLVIVTVFSGLSFEPVSTASMLSRTSPPSVKKPKIV